MSPAGIKSRRAVILFLATLCSLLVVLGWEGSPASTVLAQGWRPAHRLELEIAVRKESPRTRVFKQRDCEFHKGKWVKDSSRPLYSGKSCSQFLSGMWACRLTAREDFEYEKYKWQPDDCDLPKFDGTKFLSRWKHKTIAFVGDSLGRQQFQSLLCMITRGRDTSRDVVDVGKDFGFDLRPSWALRPDGWAYRFRKTNTTVLFYWSASLCKIQAYKLGDPTSASAMHLDKPPDFLKQYLNRIHVLVLNTGHHWNSGKINGNRWEMFVDGNRVQSNSSFGSIAYAQNFAVKSLVKWLDKRLRNKTAGARVFMTSLSPRHFMNGDWNSGGRCDNVKPFNVDYTRRPSRDLGAENVIRNTRVEFLNITLLSQLRGEAHISRYSPKSKTGIQDCLHWCLPGIPDVWNEILNAQLLQKG